MIDMARNSEIDGGDGEGWCDVCNDGQEGYPYLHTAEEILAELGKSRAKVEKLREWPKKHGIPALRAAQTGWDDCRPRVDEALEHAVGLLVDD